MASTPEFHNSLIQSFQFLKTRLRSYLSTIPTYDSHLNYPFLLSRSGNSFLKNSHLSKKNFHFYLIDSWNLSRNLSGNWSGNYIWELQKKKGPSPVKIVKICMMYRGIQKVLQIHCYEVFFVSEAIWKIDLIKFSGVLLKISWLYKGWEPLT